MTQLTNQPANAGPPSVHQDETDEFVPQPISLTLRILNLIAIITPFAGLVAAIALLWGPGFGWVHFGVLLGMYLLSGLGITVGYHRFFTHRAFETNRVIKFILGVAGSMAVEGPVLRWVATHRKHHQHSDLDDDPHSPHSHGSGFRNMMRGLWCAHVGWIFEPDCVDFRRYTPDLNCDKLTRFVHVMFPVWVLLGMLIPTVIAGLVTMSWTGAFLGFIWGGLVRVFLVHHVTWSINSVCHIWGTRPFKSHDHSRNNPIFGVLAFGEGWHNNHHAFPTSARHGLRWWEVDTSYLIIRGLSLVGLAWNVRTPEKSRMDAKRMRRKRDAKQ